jgi:hypothetical protein
MASNFVQVTLFTFHEFQLSFENGFHKMVVCGGLPGEFICRIPGDIDFPAQAVFLLSQSGVNSTNPTFAIIIRSASLVARSCLSERSPIG